VLGWLESAHHKNEKQVAYMSFSLFTRLYFPLLVLNALRLPLLPSENETEVAQENRKRAAVPLIITHDTRFTDPTSDFW